MNSRDLRQEIYHRFGKIYKRLSPELFDKLIVEIERIKRQVNPSEEKWSERDCFLITYGDSIIAPGKKSLPVLNTFLNDFIGDTINRVHILPFFPYTSDDGFSVIDYREVNPALGTWNDISQMGKNRKLMFDLVINHVSQQNQWFRNFLEGTDPGTDYFIAVDPQIDLSAVIRPRSLPLLTAFETRHGTKYVWTTFSSDQIDLNFANPEVLIQMLLVLLFYIEKGASVIRLDAIAFLWKEPGTSCLHLSQTHEIVKLMRFLKDYIDPSIILITETNVPNKENLSYFAEGNEADMIYQFSLPPLLLHALYSGSSHFLNQWLASIADIPTGCTFFNFTASHDGIGVRPLEGILPPDEITKLAEAMKQAGGLIGTRRQPDGTDSPYEINITYFDAMKVTEQGMDEFQIERFLCSQTIMMSLVGIPAFYIHSLLGTHNAYDEVKRTGMNRSINRKKWNSDELYNLLKTESVHSTILQGLLRRISVRNSEPCFHPTADQSLIINGESILALSRGNDKTLVIVANLKPEPITLGPIVGGISVKGRKDLISEIILKDDELLLKPYQVVWLKR